MPFCPNCGKEVPPEAKFCPSCGFQIRKETSSKPNITTDNSRARNYLLFATAGMGAVALISLIIGDVLGFVLAAALCAALYFWGMKKFDEGDINTAKITAVVCAIIAGVIGLAALVMARSWLGVIDILVAIPAFLSWREIEQQ